MADYDRYNNTRSVGQMLASEAVLHLVKEVSVCGCRAGGPVLERPWSLNLFCLHGFIRAEISHLCVKTWRLLCDDGDVKLSVTSERMKSVVVL